MNETRLGERSAHRGASWMLALSSVAVAAFLVSLFLRANGSYYEPIDGWGVAGFELLMGLVCAGRYFEGSWRRSDSVAKAFPLVLGASCLSWAVGDLVVTIQYGGATPSVPSFGDGFYLAFFPLAYLGLMLLIRRGKTGSLVSIALDGLIAGMGAASLCAAYLFSTLLHAAGGGALSAATKTAYPVGDLLLLTLAVGAQAVLPRQYRRFLVITSVAMAVNATGDFYNLLQPNSHVGYVTNGAAWPVALLMLATAVWTQPTTDVKVGTDATAGFTLPGLGALASVFILFTASVSHVSRAAVGLATGTLLVAGLRLALTVREGQLLKTARFRSLIDKAWDIIVVAEADLSVAYVTPSSERVLGYAPAELQGSPFRSLVHPDDSEMIAEHLTRLLDAPTETAVFETRMRHRNGGWHIIAWTATNLLADASVRGYVLNGGDVTEARQTAEDLAAARDGALMASKAKSQFLSTMSHEIRTPMNGVIGLTELLLDSTLDRDQQELASGIKVSAESLLVIINDILDFSKVEAGKLELEEAAISIPGVVDDVGRILAGAAHKKGIELLVDVDHDVPATLLGDGVRLQQVLLNLGSNAVKFTFEGEVVIRVSVLRGNTERVALRFEVVDMGIGIALEDQDRLFRAFAQADSSTTRRFGGTGLGLAISRQLVELMGGRLGLISAPGEGSTFWFEVSLGRAVEGPSVPPTEVDPDTLAGKRALIVDDNATNRRILRQQLLSWGLDAVEAVDAYQALGLAEAAAAAGQTFDLGVIDHNMPGMDGIELAQVLKANPPTAATTLFLLSSSGERLSAAECHLRGFSASLTKPVRSSELFDCLISGVNNDVATLATSPAELDQTEVMGMILLVEDNKMNQLVGSKTLAKLGYAFDIANDGREAVDAVRAMTYDAVLMDCQMPVMDGYEATSEIRRIEGSTRRTPIIAMTAAAMEGDRETCLAAGMDDYLSKPVRVDVLAGLLDRWVQQRMPYRYGPDQRSTPGYDGQQETLDHTQIERLRDLDEGDGLLLGELIEQYVAQTSDGRRLLAHGVSGGDAAAIGRTAHTVRGASANLGAVGLASVCAELEMCARQPQMEGLADLMARFDREFDRVQDALNLLTARA